jgi:hypothetical protein
MNIKTKAKVQTVSTSEMWVIFYKITSYNIPEGSRLHTRRCENLVSHEYPDIEI